MEINIAKLLKNCPKGTELYSPLCGDCKLVKVQDYKNNIVVELDSGDIIVFKPNGKYYNYPNAECLLFPKGKTTWERFHRPFKDGDIIYFITENDNEMYCRNSI